MWQQLRDRDDGPRDRRGRRAHRRPPYAPRGRCPQLAGVFRSGIAGVTLIEVMAATVITGIGLVGVGSIVTYGVISHRKAVEYTVAAARATKEVERVREAGYLGAESDASLFPAPDYTIISANHVSFSVDGLKDGVGYVTISEDPEAQSINPSTGQSYGNMKQVAVHIFWDRPGEQTGSYSIATLISNRP